MRFYGFEVGMFKIKLLITWFSNSSAYASYSDCLCLEKLLINR